MKSVGEILKTARKKRGYSRLEVSRQTKIQINYLESIENNKFESLPSATFVKGFIQNYAKAVGVKPESLLAVFRRDFIQGPKGGIIPRGLTKPIKSSNVFNPRTTMILVFTVLSILIVGFFTRQIFLFYSGPTLEITNPAESTTVSSPVSVSGNTSVDANVFVNDKEVTVDPNGNFKTEIQLTEGEHIVVVRAVDRNGREKARQRFFTVVGR